MVKNNSKNKNVYPLVLLCAGLLIAVGGFSLAAGLKLSEGFAALATVISLVLGIFISMLGLKGMRTENKKVKKKKNARLDETMFTENKDNHCNPEADFLRRSFTATDGLWFMMVEQTYGFDAAMELDHRVWEVMGKIQARTAREITGAHSSDTDSLEKCIRLKFSAEDYETHTECRKPECLDIHITSCPWLKILMKTSRTNIAEIIARKICTAELNGWAKEFGMSLDFSPEKTKCCGERYCGIRFSRNPVTPFSPAK